MFETLVNTFQAIGPGHFLTIWAAIILAAVLRAFTGFGFALAAMPVLSLFLSPPQAVVLTVVLALMISLLTVRSFWHVAPRRSLVPIVVFALLGTVLGALALRTFSVAQFQLWIGLSVIVASALLTFYRPRPRRVGNGIRALTGLCSGLMNGAFAIPGPPIIIFAMATEVDAARSRALLMVYFMMTALMALPVYAALGYITPETLALIVIGLPAMLIGDRLGHALFARFGTRLYRTIALAVLYVVGLSTTLRALLS